MKQPNIAICFSLITVILCQSVVQAMVFPIPEWQASAPEAQGIDSEELENAMRYLNDHCGAQGTSQTIVIVNGFIIWKGSDIDKKQNVLSCAKSFTSTILGLLIDDEKCTLDTLAQDYDTALSLYYPALNLRHFVTMESGYNAIGDDQSGTPFDVAPPLYNPPGSANDYWDAAMNELSYVLTLINRGAIDTLFKQRIADPIGMDPTKWSWGDWGEIDGLKVNGGAGNYGGISISASDMARFGFLFLNRGCWDGVQLISSSWVDQATRLQVPISVPWSGHRFDVSGQYGFNWWVNDSSKIQWHGAPEGTYAAVGADNNKLFIIPKWRMVVVRLGPEGDGDIEDDIWGTFFSKIGIARQNTPTIEGRIETPSDNVIIPRGQSVNFSSNCTDSSNLAADLSFLWQFGNGSGISDSTNQNPGLVTFNTAGTFNVVFTCFDGCGLSDLSPDTRVVTVTESSGDVAATESSGDGTVGGGSSCFISAIAN